MKSIPVTCPHCQALQSYIEGERSPCCYNCGATLLSWKDNRDERRVEATEAETGTGADDRVRLDTGDSSSSGCESPTGGEAFTEGVPGADGEGTGARGGVVIDGMQCSAAVWGIQAEPTPSPLSAVKTAVKRITNLINDTAPLIQALPRVHRLEHFPKFRSRARRLRAVGFDVMRQMYLLANGGQIGVEKIYARESYPERTPRRESRRARKRRQR